MNVLSACLFLFSLLLSLVASLCFVTFFLAFRTPNRADIFSSLVNSTYSTYSWNAENMINGYKLQCSLLFFFSFSLYRENCLNRYPGLFQKYRNVLTSVIVGSCFHTILTWMKIEEFHLWSMMCSLFIRPTNKYTFIPYRGTGSQI